jgi:uncharacterized membrane protein YgcG
LISQANPVSEDDTRSRRREVAGLSLRTRLLRLMVASILPLLAFSLGSQYVQYREAVTATGQRTMPGMMLGLMLLTGALRSQGFDIIRTLIFGLTFAGGGAYFGLWILFAYRQDWTEVLPTAVALAPVAVFAFPLFKKPTQAGRKVMDAIEGFRLYLGVAEEDRLQALYPPKKTPELFERYLPYAIALDVENAWAKRFEGVIENASMEDTEAVWCMGDGIRLRNPAVLTEFVSKNLSEKIASASTPPGTSGSSSGSSYDSSSSGSSGGGSSGGGGGGGGGSGW